MRRFLLIAHRVPVDGGFTLNDLAGGAGRMDEVARSVSTAFTISNDLRRDTEFTVLFVSDPARARRIRLTGSRLRFLNPDERSTAALLKNALVRSALVLHDVECSPGLTVGPVEPTRALEEFAATPDALWLTEGGGSLGAWRSPTGGFSAVLGDPVDLSEAERELLVRKGVPPVSVGPRSLRTSQVVDVLQNEFDRREQATGPAPA